MLNIIANLNAKDDRLVDQAFAELYRENYPVIRSYIKDNNGSDADAADIFQDALIVLYDKVRTPHFQLTCTIKTFIYSICRNLWLKKLTYRKKQLIIKDTLPTVELEANIMEILENDEQSSMVAKLLKEIGDDAKQILIYYYFEGLKTNEVTEKMGFANDFVTRNKKSSSLKKLRELIATSKSLKDFLS